MKLNFIKTGICFLKPIWRNLCLKYELLIGHIENHKVYQFCSRIPLIWVTYTVMPPHINIFKIVFYQKVSIQDTSEIYVLVCYSISVIIIIILPPG